MLQWVLLIVSIVASPCPRLQCLPLVSDICVVSNSTDLLISQCPDQDVCPTFNLHHISDQSCSPAQPGVQPTSAKACLKRYETGQTCTKDRPCQSGLYCHSPDEVCKKQQDEGSYCTDLWECGKGTVCNKGVCVLYFSVADKEPADSRVACKSGIVSGGLCRKASKSKESLPVYCTKDADCTATDGTLGTCKCPFAKESGGICDLQKSDKPIKEFLRALHDGETEKATYMQKWILTYPRSEYAETCLQREEEGLIALGLLRDWAQRCLALSLTAVFRLTALYVVI